VLLSCLAWLSVGARGVFGLSCALLAVSPVLSGVSFAPIRGVHVAPEESALEVIVLFEFVMICHMSR
jgi:hypothetical protein